MHGQYLSAGWPLDRRGSARAHGGTAGGQTRDSEAAAGNRRAPVRQHQAMDEPGYLSPAWTGEGSGRIQPDGAGLQFHSRGEHRKRGDPPQSDVKESGLGELPALRRFPAGHLTSSRRWRSVMRRPEMATALRDLIASNATHRSVFTRSGPFLILKVEAAASVSLSGAFCAQTTSKAYPSGSGGTKC